MIVDVTGISMDVVLLDICVIVVSFEDDSDRSGGLKETVRK